MDAELKSLQIDRKAKQSSRSRLPRWIMPVMVLCLLLGAGSFVFARLTSAPEVTIARVRTVNGASVDADMHLVSVHPYFRGADIADL